ncbi:MAG: M23 family metallopeptidase [Burkholderiaceae bacterium]|nr:M23 family metallopeptidase [Burkholderiaceae bacterium]
MSPPALPSFPKVATAVAVTLTLVAVTAFGTAPLREVELPPVQTIVERVAIAPSLQSAEAVVPAPLQHYARSERIRRGETLVSLLDRLGATDVDFQKFVAADRRARKLMQLQAGRTVNALIDEAGRVQSLQYRYAHLDSESDEPTQPTGRVTIRRADLGFGASDEPISLSSDRSRWRSPKFVPRCSRRSTRRASPRRSLPTSPTSSTARSTSIVTCAAATSCAWSYETIRESDSLDPPTIGRILALEFTINGARHEAVWFDREGSEHGEYFTFDGRSLRKAFLHHPVEFSRISSGFSNARMHPILKYTREHKGVDFAAPIGTKVRSSGDGVVEFVGQQRGYGNIVEIRHRNGISTLYAHLNGFASGLSKGAKVAQGAVIGYVGTTGWSTGPHLHYEFKVAGEQVDPLSVVLPPAAPLDAAERVHFMARTAGLRTRLAQTDGVVRLARFE